MRNSSQDFFEDEKTNINVQDKAIIVLNLKKLGLFVENQEVLELYPEDKLLELKIFCWIIKELYFSPYKIYLKDLNYNTLCLKFLKAKQYTSTDEGYDIERVIAYTIKCLREEFEKNNRKE